MAEFEKMPEEPDLLEIAIRAYPVKSPNIQKVTKAGDTTSRQIKRRRISLPSEWYLIFDTETTTDAAQALRFGTYQIRKGMELHEQGIFYDANALSADEIEAIIGYSKSNNQKLLTRDEFAEVFFRYGYWYRGTVVGLNLPFDISRIAICHSSARGKMRRGFSFKLSMNPWRPAIQIKHLSQRSSLIRFAGLAGQRDSRGERRRGFKTPIRRGHFVDIGTLAAAMFSRSFGLASLSEFLKVEHPKLIVDGHGSSLDAKYIDYAVRDVQCTWECFAELKARHGQLKLGVLPDKIYSEASIGKSYLRAMGVKPWLEAQPDAPPDLIGKIMGSFYGGRAEVHIRRSVRQVMLCDFLSMYPTVCTLMGLWRFVIAGKTHWRDGTVEIREFLADVTLDELHERSVWRRLSVLVRVKPAEDIFPVRAAYADGGTKTIGLNYLSSEEPLWFTLADCVASKLLTGRTTEIIQALVFSPGEPQSRLRPIEIGGDADCQVVPYQDDFYCKLIELRQSVKEQMSSGGVDSETLKIKQQAFKIAANATAYGIFAEFNADDLPKPEAFDIYSIDGDPFQARSDKLEKPGPFFHPVLAALITGAARLMLAITECLISSAGLDWCFCDTDSMAIAKPENTGQVEFVDRVNSIVRWFEVLNPYKFGGSILKIENLNFGIENQKDEQLYCWAISAKRYVLFNIDQTGRPIIRKASAHGLGHRLAPYTARAPDCGTPDPQDKLANIGVELWQHDLWWQIASAALSGRPDQVALDWHPALETPAISRYAATTPDLLNWFKKYNEPRPYWQQVRPFGFLISLSAISTVSAEEPISQAQIKNSRPLKTAVPRPVAPYTRDPIVAAANAFDRDTAIRLHPGSLKSYRQDLARYHLHPEDKFLNGDYLDTGLTRRRHVIVRGLDFIGKEANRWEEQFFTGPVDSAEAKYGYSPVGHPPVRAALQKALKVHSQRELSNRLGVPRRVLAQILRPSTKRLAANAYRSIFSALAELALADRIQDSAERIEREELNRRIASEGLTQTANSLGIDPSNLRKMASGNRKIRASSQGRAAANRDQICSQIEPRRFEL